MAILVTVTIVVDFSAGSSGWPAPERGPDVLGRMLLALQRETDLRDVLRSLDFWAGGGPGGGYVLEWWEGPYADEVYRELVAQLVEGESRLLAPSDFALRTDRLQHDPHHRLFLRVRDVAIELRSCDPIGLEEALQRRNARLRAVAGAAGRSMR